MPDLVSLLADRLRASAEVKASAAADPELLARAADAARRIADALRTGHKVLFFGNGGSAMDAGHLAAELLGRYYLERDSLAAVALPDLTAAMTAIGNDYGYADVFARQVRGLGRPGDVAVGLSTSGNSPNVLKGLRAARDGGLVTVAFTGAEGGKCAEFADVLIDVPSVDTPRVQECHMVIGHTICEIIEAALAAD